MIEVKFTEKKNEIQMSGHANYDVPGQDIVCAAASILAYSLAQTIKNLEAQGCLAEKPTLQLDKNETKIKCKAKPEYRANVQMAFYVAVTGFDLLSHNYKKNINFLVAG